MENVHNLIKIGATNPIQILNKHGIFWKFCMCSSNDTFDKKYIYVGTGSAQQQRNEVY